MKAYLKTITLITLLAVTVSRTFTRNSNFEEYEPVWSQSGNLTRGSAPHKETFLSRENSRLSQLYKVYTEEPTEVIFTDSEAGSAFAQFEKFLAERRAKVSESPSHVRQDRTFTWLDDLKKNPLAQKAASETKKLVQNEAAKLFCKDELKKFKESIKNLTFLNDVNEEDLGIDDLFEEAMPSPQAIKKLTKGEIAALEKKMLEDCVARYIVKGVNKAISEGLKGTKGQSFYERFINRD